MKNEDPTAYKVGLVELIAKKPCFVLSRLNRKDRGEFLGIFQTLSGTLRQNKLYLLLNYQARRRGGSRCSNEPPFKINNGGLKMKC